MTQKANETTGRNENAGTTQIFSLICIHNPVRKTGCRIEERSGKAVVQTDEHKIRGVLPGQNLWERAERPLPAVAAEPEYKTVYTAAEPGDIRSETLAEFENPGLPVQSENKTSSPEQTAPDMAGGDAS